MELDLSIPGAREERAKLKLLHSHLNHPEVIPEQVYRRNSSGYPLASYLNNICGLYLSKNYEVIPIFINRAHQHMEEHPASANSKAYYELAGAYIRQMAYILSTYTNITKECLSFIPAEILAAGPQALVPEQGT